ncbi:Putative HotDog domain superfamily protein [Colletotrichum destructivum]|uniref:HotDog domain superfamily protein n=1 Tax=Colletotrichum destructivum TaxID=34406 RepID=A0AAX4IUT5_9PEZI|nr:Putative HotDog domain superfamily protein [Colletotrichum destructivum]
MEVALHAAAAASTSQSVTRISGVLPDRGLVVVPATALYVLGPHLAGQPSVLHSGASAAVAPARKAAVTVTLEMTYRALIRLDANGNWEVVAACVRVHLFFC